MFMKGNALLSDIILNPDLHAEIILHKIKTKDAIEGLRVGLIIFNIN